MRILLWYWEGISIKHISRFIGIDRKTIGFWGSVVRVVCMNVWNESQVQIGGEGKTVEIDEAVWRRRKFKRGRRKEQIWIFGGVERLEGGGAGPRFVMIVPNRRKETLLLITLERIRPGTTIMSDEWKAYSTSNLHNYIHKTVCHKRHFVDPESGACANAIEGLWGTLRKSFPHYEVRKSLIPDHFSHANGEIIEG
ncbi:putative Uncharacterized transposase-like protein [Monocercomonoides exilis]|uniref:putative Uncharacterized transposase-like protein n=1 Tax=Monocercomonoides exilis TaxID=2049356 RepID=UPI0035594482|nr:putative Uncharacterized transposase-like protein [Monocercomonoides exilis]|eukprot:MONOS_6138.1-p1 / transcript=MONOS_6138.1 / gene=MONOS_6138 / organism=Monocercomonoides_exilis_PA203 / gene_product=Uncharacterized transposase-like protein HI1328.1 / transcript_product=Uncharacterized transposase-like protein HI1328.1 / location=Mono_scaffold00189:70152-70739(+) / protein_length=195 / sequence_SO=supercontig / SO=protein_coding / is_pseudo=false